MSKRKKKRNKQIARLARVNSPRILLNQIDVIEKRLLGHKIGKRDLTKRFAMLEDAFSLNEWLQMNGIELEDFDLPPNATKTEILSSLIAYFHPKDEIKSLKRKRRKLRKAIDRGEWKPTMTIAEAAKYLSCRTEQIKYLIRNDRVESVLAEFVDSMDRIQKKRFITVESLDFYYTTKQFPNYWHTRYGWKFVATPKEVELIQAALLEIGLSRTIEITRIHTRHPERRTV